MPSATNGILLTSSKSSSLNKNDWCDGERRKNVFVPQDADRSSNHTRNREDVPAVEQILVQSNVMAEELCWSCQVRRQITSVNHYNLKQ